MTQGMARGIPLGRFLVWLGLAAGWLAGRAVAADAPLTPNLRYDLDYSTGIFWKVGGGATPLSYTLLPQIITLKIPPIHEWPCGDGTLVMRSRFSLLLEPILHGPEDYYLGLAAAGEVEWRDSSRRFTAFFASGGGFGWMNSKG
jgi:lipid A 3-O-deacylase